MQDSRRTQSDIALALLERQGIARLSELVEAGASATAISRLKEKGIVVQRIPTPRAALLVRVVPTSLLAC